MIDLLDIKLSQLLPASFEDEKLQALNNVITYSLRLLQKYIENVNFTVNLDNVSENIIDYLACEYRTPYYDDTFDLQMKRNLVKATMLVFQKKGTPGVIKEYLKLLSNEVDVVEWDKYDGEPYNFKIFITVPNNSEITEEMVADIREKIEKLKNLRSTLDEVDLLKKLENEKTLAVVTGSCFATQKNIKDAESYSDAMATFKPLVYKNSLLTAGEKFIIQEVQNGI